MRAMYTSTANCATRSMFRFYRMFGVNSYHQHISLSQRESDCIAYSLDDFPQHIRVYLEKVKKVIKGQDPYFNSDWGCSAAVYPLQTLYPGLRIIIGIREPNSQSNALRRTRWKIDPEKIDLDYFGEAWCRLYGFLAEQAKYMDPKPVWCDFKKLVSCGYDEALFKMFDIKPSKENFKKAKKHWAEPFGSLKPYPVDRLSEDMNNRCTTVMSNLKAICEELS